MKLKYNLLWIENEEDWMESVEDDIKSMVEDNAFEYVRYNCKQEEDGFKSGQSAIGRSAYQKNS